MDRRAFLGTLALLAAPRAAEAQPTASKPRLCFLTFDPGTLQSARFQSFFRGLRDLGYVDGQTVTIDHRVPLHAPSPSTGRPRVT